MKILKAPPQGVREIVIVALELHAEHIVVDFIASTNKWNITPGSPGAAIEIEDDIGTDYEARGLEASGGNDARRGAAFFRPTAPREASLLTVRTIAGDVTFDCGEGLGESANA